MKDDQDNAVLNSPSLFKLLHLWDEKEKLVPPFKDLNEYSRIVVAVEVVCVRGYTSVESRSISGLRDNNFLHIMEVKYIKPHTMYEMNRKECNGSYNDDGSSMQHVVIDKVQCYINPVGNKVMNSCIIPVLKYHPFKPLLYTQNCGNTVVSGGSLLISSYGNVQMGAGISEQIGDADKTRWRKGQYEVVCGLPANATPDETRLALHEMEENVFDTAKANKPMSNRAMKLKEDKAVLHQLTTVNEKYNSQKDGIVSKYNSTANKELDKLVTIPHFVTYTLSVRYSLSLKTNNCCVPKEFGSIPSDSLELEPLSDCCIVLTHTAWFQIYMIVSPDQQKNKLIVLIVCAYVLEDKPNQDMIATSQASLVFTPDDILNLFQTYDEKFLPK